MFLYEYIFLKTENSFTAFFGETMIYLIYSLMNIKCYKSIYLKQKSFWNFIKILYCPFWLI